MEDSGNSESSTTQQTTSTSTDARVGADNGSIVIQAGGQQNISFSPEVADLGKNVVNSIVDFSGKVLSGAQSVITESIMSQRQALESSLNFAKTSIAASPATSSAASAGILSQQSLETLKVPLIIGALAIAAIIFIKRK